MGKPRTFTPDEIERFKAMRRKRWSVKLMCRDLRCTDSTIARLAAELGLPPRPGCRGGARAGAGRPPSTSSHVPKPTLPTKDRECMNKECGRIFRSQGAHHRLCDECRKGSALEPFPVHL